MKPFCCFLFSSSFFFMSLGCRVKLAYSCVCILMKVWPPRVAPPLQSKYAHSDWSEGKIRIALTRIQIPPRQLMEAMCHDQSPLCAVTKQRQLRYRFVLWWRRMQGVNLKSSRSSSSSKWERKKKISLFNMHFIPSVPVAVQYVITPKYRHVNVFTWGLQ